MYALPRQRYKLGGTMMMPPRSSKRCGVQAPPRWALAALLLPSLLVWPLVTTAAEPPALPGSQPPETSGAPTEEPGAKTTERDGGDGDPGGAAEQGSTSEGDPEPTAPAAGDAAPPDGPAAVSSQPAAADGPLGEDDEPLISAMDLGALVGFGVRLDRPSALSSDSRVGLRFGLGANVLFSDVVAVGLQIEHLDLGRESSGVGENGIVNVDRDLNSLWLGLRAYPFSTGVIGAYVNLGVAASWQSLSAAGVGWEDGRPDRGRSFRCEGSDSISAALRAGIGVDFQVTPGLQLVTAAGFDSYRLSDEVLDGCAPGAGNASVLTAELALAYRFAPGL